MPTWCRPRRLLCAPATYPPETNSLGISRAEGSAGNEPTEGNGRSRAGRDLEGSLQAPGLRIEVRRQASFTRNLRGKLKWFKRALISALQPGSASLSRSPRFFTDRKSTRLKLQSHRYISYAVF